jgi:hypothetical protein
MITKTITTPYGDVTSNAEISHTDTGQVLIHIISTLGSTTHQHSVTIGSTDGIDSVSGMTEADIQASIQKHLDEKRAEAASVLAGRAKVAKISTSLV